MIEHKMETVKDHKTMIKKGALILAGCVSLTIYPAIKIGELKQKSPNIEKVWALEREIDLASGLNGRSALEAAVDNPNILNKFRSLKEQHAGLETYEVKLNKEKIEQYQHLMTVVDVIGLCFGAPYILGGICALYSDRKRKSFPKPMKVASSY